MLSRATSVTALDLPFAGQDLERKACEQYVCQLICRPEDNTRDSVVIGICVDAVSHVSRENLIEPGCLSPNVSSEWRWAFPNFSRQPDWTLECPADPQFAAVPAVLGFAAASAAAAAQLAPVVGP